VALCACRQPRRDAAPVTDVVPSADLAPRTVGEGEALVVTYRWRTGPSFERLGRDYHVLVHLVDAEGAILVAEDHAPSPPTSTWEPSREYSYARPLFAPSFYSLHLKLRVGLFLGDQRLALRAAEARHREYEVGAFDVVRRPAESATVQFEGGWDLHSGADDPLRPVHWLRGDAGAVLVRSPGEDAVLVIEAAVGRARAEDRPVAKLSLGPAAWSLPLREGEFALVRLRVPAAAWEGRDRAALRVALRLDASGRPREPSREGGGLGLRGVALLPVSSAPPDLVLAALEPKPEGSAQ
jgi:hypothetical protein